MPATDAEALAQLATEAEAEADAARGTASTSKIDERLAQVGPVRPALPAGVPTPSAPIVQGVTFNSVWGVDFWTAEQVDACVRERTSSGGAATSLR